MPHRRLIAGLIAAALTLPTAAQSKRPITEMDLMKFIWVADPQLSPDGSEIAFVRVSVNEKRDGYETAIWIVPSDGSQAPRRLTGGTRDVAPRWAPDGRRLAFIRSVEKDGAPQPSQVYVMPMTGGEARALTDIPRGALNPEWAPDGRRIVFTTAATPEDLKKHTAKDAKDAKDAKEGKRESDVRVISKAVYRANAGGYVDPERRNHIWTVAVPDGTWTDSPAPTRITSGDFDEQQPVWAPDGSRIYFVSTRVDEPYYRPQDSDLYAVAAGGGDVIKIASIDGIISQPRPSPDGKRIAFVGTPHGNPVRSYSQPDLFVADAAPGATPRNLTTTYDFQIGGSIGGDQSAPRGGQPGGPVWTKDGRAILIVAGEHGNANIKRIDVGSGKVDAVISGNQAVVAYTSASDASKLAVTISTPTRIGDVFVVEPALPGAMKQVTNLNGELFAELALSEAEELWYQSFDGRKIQGWILKPPDFDPSRKYPLVLEIHGGPHAAYGNTFTHEFSWMAAKGYVVLYTNPRGSTTYGQEFGNLIQHNYPGDDYKDLMAGVDALLERGYLDQKRLGVTGGSGGGVLTNWTITHTTRFAAAVSQRSIADWSGFWYTADFTLFQPTWFKAAPWEDPADFAARSPITHIAKVTTPLMLIEGEDDLRTPPGDGGEQMFRAMKYLKKPVVMVRFPGETHELSRSGKPLHRVERLQHIVAWFDKYLQGKKVDTYDP